MYFDYANVMVFLFAGAGFVFINMYLGALIRPNNPNSEKLTPYECGEDPIGNAWIRFDIRYYTVALVYIVFAVEVAFLFPWARILKGTVTGEVAIPKSVAFFEGLVFIAILFLGLAYVWAKGDLDWVKTVEKPQMPEGKQKPSWREIGKVPAASGPQVLTGRPDAAVPMDPAKGKSS